MADYIPTDWKDEIKDGAGNVVQKGTPLSAANLKKLEAGVEGAVAAVVGKVDGAVFEQFKTATTTQLADTAKDTNVLKSITNRPIHLKNGFGADLSGINDSTDALELALNSGGSVQLPEVCTVKISRTFLLAGNKEIIGMGRNSVIKLGADVTLFDIQSSGVKLINLRIVVPDSNTQPVIRLKPKTALAVNYTLFEDVWIESEGQEGNWIGLQWDLSVGFLIYKNTFERLVIKYPKIGIQVVGGASGQSGATGNYFRDLEIMGFGIAIDLQTNDSFQNNYFYGQLEAMRNNVDSVGVKMTSGWGNQFILNHWYDIDIGGRYITYQLDAPTHSNVVEGHIEGEYIDNGFNIFNAWYTKRDYTTTGNTASGKYNDILNNTDSSANNLLFNSDFTIGNIAGWAPYDANVTIARDSTVLNRVVMKLTSNGTTIRNAYQDFPEVSQFAGKYVYAGVWAMVPISTGRPSSIAIQDGVTSTFSDLIPNDGKWYWVTIKHKVANVPTVLRVELGRVNASLGYTTAVGGIVYFANAVMTFGGRIRPQDHSPEKRLFKYTPSNGGELGRKGTTTYDDNYIYIWTNDNIVRRTPLSSW